MSIGPIVPCLWFDDQAEAAAAFYTKIFPASRVVSTSHYPESYDNPGKKPRGSVLTVDVDVAGQRFTLLNGGPMFVINPSISFFFHADSEAQAKKVFGALAEGGKVLMELGSYPWSPAYGWVQDRYGVSWQVMQSESKTGARIVPCLMFTGAQHGRAREAIELFTKILPNGEVFGIERYAKGEGPEDTVKHGRFTVAGQELVAMDSHMKNDFNFNEAVSPQIMCDTQAEIDRVWKALTDGGREGPCGWLTDRFGISWQVVPKGMARWMASTDVAARDRAFAAMLTMKKIDVAAIEAAFEGRTQPGVAHP
jgi:predicted 3-demethylubiquinone-9 3-methyltransferase (glyoxalase superfamily)